MAKKLVSIRLSLSALDLLDNIVAKDSCSYRPINRTSAINGILLRLSNCVSVDDVYRLLKGQFRTIQIIFDNEFKTSAEGHSE